MTELLETQVGVEAELLQPPSVLWGNQDVDGHDDLTVDFPATRSPRFRLWH